MDRATPSSTSAINRGGSTSHAFVARWRVPLPRASDGRSVPAVDVSPWLRPDADTCSNRSFCHTFGRGLGKHQMVPGWPYSIVAALETGRASWRTALLDTIRLEPGADLAAATTEQVREVVERLVVAGLQQADDPKALVVLDAGYDGLCVAYLLADLPVEVPVTTSDASWPPGESSTRPAHHKAGTKPRHASG
ncbi:transposase [Streptomyces sp. NPDC093546]|uniref:transposase n=1 Tax=Streptomyces sp. NPDC093546 TaxID=3366040 RepID=UPI0038036D2B